ncbi:MAG: regulatory, FmdB family domain protein [Frankiales bacterium]|jgi:putative FmdB family regulatory protein|nr:regulatory, FmdB family domain protein [Frankiales bacterium]
MPAYDYRCRTCDAPFEVRRSLTDDAPALCPAGHDDVGRVFTPVAVGGSAAPAAPAGGCCGGGCCG